MDLLCKLPISFRILDLMLSMPDALLFGNLHIIGEIFFGNFDKFRPTTL